MTRPPEDLTPEERVPDPMAELDADRFNTRALDLGAVRAIDAAYASGSQHAGGDADRAGGAEAAGSPDRAVGGAETAGDVAGVSSRGEARGAQGAAGRCDAGAREAGAPLATVEIDYSPATRAARERAVKVQRVARGVTVTCVVGAVVLGGWALLRAGRAPVPSGPPIMSARQVASFPAGSPQIEGSSPPAASTHGVATPSAGVLSSTPSAPGQSTIPTAAVQTVAAPQAGRPPAPRTPGGAVGSAPGSTSGRGSVAAPAVGGVPPPATSPLPAGTVSVPILE